jgi:aromatic-amino-acid transaminase
MFSLLPLSPEQVDALRSKYSIYVAADGRINVCGISDGNVKYVADKIARSMS